MPTLVNEADVKLMLAMIGSAEGLKTDNQKLSELLGGGSTANAIRQRVQKIKAHAKSILAGEEVDLKGASGRTASSTPSKRKIMEEDGVSGESSPASTKKPKAKGIPKRTPKGRGNKKNVKDMDGDVFKEDSQDEDGFVSKNESPDEDDSTKNEDDAALRIDGTYDEA